MPAVLPDHRGHQVPVFVKVWQGPHPAAGPGGSGLGCGLVGQAAQHAQGATGGQVLAHLLRRALQPRLKLADRQVLQQCVDDVAPATETQHIAARAELAGDIGELLSQPLQDLFVAGVHKVHVGDLDDLVLAVPVDAAVPLLQPVRVPRQLVVDQPWEPCCSSGPRRRRRSPAAPHRVYGQTQPAPPDASPRSTFHPRGAMAACRGCPGGTPTCPGTR